MVVIKERLEKYADVKKSTDDSGEMVSKSELSKIASSKKRIYI